MKQHQRRLAYIAGASALTFLGVLAACSDDATTPLPGGDTFTNPDSGRSTSGATTSGATTSGSTGDDDDTTVTDAGGADCSAAPKLHSTASGFFCAFFKDAGPDSGSASNCANNETCCNPGKSGSSFPASYCAVASTKDDNGVADCTQGATDQSLTWITTGGTTWECGGATNCDGKKCCAFSVPGADAGNTVNVGNDTSPSAAPKACSPKYVYKIGGTKCADDCDPTSELELCSSTDNCSDSTATCLAAGTTGFRELGVCVKPKTH